MNLQVTYVIHRGDDSPVAIGTDKKGRTVAVWKQGEFKKYESYAMEDSVYEEVMKRNPRRILLVDQENRDVYELDIKFLKEPNEFIIPSENSRDEFESKYPLKHQFVNAFVEPLSDTDDFQRLYPKDKLENPITTLPNGKGIFDCLFSDYRD